MLICTLIGTLSIMRTPLNAEVDMKTLARIFIGAAAVLLLFGFITDSNADGRRGFRGNGGYERHEDYGGRGGVSIWLEPAWGPRWWGPYYNPYYYPYYPEPPVIIEQRPEIYVQPSPQTEQQSVYWYYCLESKAYYPYVKKCPGGWLKVVPTPPSPASGPPN